MSGRAGAAGGRRGGAVAWQSEGRTRAPLIKRWIGVARRRADRQRPELAGDGAQIITLTWEQTFGRPSRMSAADCGGGHPAVVVPLRSCA